MRAPPKRALVTRPREDAEGVTAELVARGFEVVVEPLLDIVAVDGAAVDGAIVDEDGIQGILATSANGIRALARASGNRSIPVYAVGDASARVARSLGYATVESAGGDVDTLADLVGRRADPRHGALLHVAGTVTAGDLSGRLGALGFTVRRQVLYEAQFPNHKNGYEKQSAGLAQMRWSHLGLILSRSDSSCLCQN